MSKSSCFFKELVGTPCGSYKVGDIGIYEITTIDRCTRDITGHLQVLHLRESTELKSKADVIFLCSGKCKNCDSIFCWWHFCPIQGERFL